MDQNKTVLYQSQLISALRQFFQEREFLDVLPPPIVECPVIEPHIQVMEVQSYKDKTHKGFLHTSPEFWMKDLLSRGDNFKKVFTIGYVFRDEPNSPIHRNQFLMMEWYRQNENYEKIIDDIQELLTFLKDKLALNDFDSSVKVMTIAEIFRETINCDILNLLESKVLIQYIKENHPTVPIPSIECDWDDYFHLLFLNEVEPKLKNYGNLILKEYPAPLSALSKIKSDDDRVCERFELFIDGIEIANCYGELTNLKEQESRAIEFNEVREKNYNHKMPRPDKLLRALENGIPDSAGIALGVERLARVLFKEKEVFWD